MSPLHVKQTDQNTEKLGRGKIFKQFKRYPFYICFKKQSLFNQNFQKPINNQYIYKSILNILKNSI